MLWVFGANCPERHTASFLSGNIVWVKMYLQRLSYVYYFKTVKGNLYMDLHMRFLLADSAGRGGGR